LNKSELWTQWTERAAKELVGRKIVSVRYMSQQEIEASMGGRSGIVLVLDDGTELLPAQDDEGNGPGALFTNIENLPIIPVI
jgi:hypothetical protein